LGASPFGGAPGTVSSVKSPQFQTAIGNALSQLGQTQYNPNVNPNILRDNTKNPALQAATQHMLGNLNSYNNPTDFTKSGQFQQNIDAGYGQYNADAAANRDQFANFKGLFDSQTPSVTSNVNQENQSIGEWYDPNGVQAHLDANAAAQARAVNLSGNRALDRVGRNNALLRMTGGDSSYANQQALDTSAAIYADEARQQGALGRANYLAVKQGQADLLGARNRGNDYLVNRQTVPINVLSQLGAAQQARLAGLGQMDLSNNIYTTPYEQGQQQLGLLGGISGIDNSNNLYTLDSQQSDLARRTALLAQLSQLNNSNNFYGLGQQYQPNTAGMLNGAPQNWGVVTPNRYNGGYTPPPAVQSTINTMTGRLAANNGAPDRILDAPPYGPYGPSPSAQASSLSSLYPQANSNPAYWNYGSEYNPNGYKQPTIQDAPPYGPMYPAPNQLSPAQQLGLMYI
jgi:hypothetical protein